MVSFYNFNFDFLVFFNKNTAFKHESLQKITADFMLFFYLL